MIMFRRGPARVEAERATEGARTMLEILKLSRADLRAPETVLREAEADLTRGSFARALESAEKSERIATAIEADYQGAAEARARLLRHAARMRELEISNDDERKALEEVRLRARSTRDVEGVAVPDYKGALTVAAAAASAAETKLVQGERAGLALFTAELAIERAQEIGGMAHEAIAEARELLGKATSEAQGGQYETASTDAVVAEKIALNFLERWREATELAESVEKAVVGLRAAGAIVAELRRSLNQGKALLELGDANAAFEVLNVAAAEARSLGTRYRELLDAMSAAAAAIEALKEEGLSSSEAEASLDRAKNALRLGNYTLASACCQDVHVALSNRRAFRDALRSSIEAAKAQLLSLRATGASFVNDAEEMVLRAESEFENGEYDASSEDLRIASLLLTPALNEKPREGPTTP